MKKRMTLAQTDAFLQQYADGFISEAEYEEWLEDVCPETGSDAPCCAYYPNCGHEV